MSDQGQLPAVEKALGEELEKAQSKDADQRALAEAFARLNPGKTHFEVGGIETEQLYEQFVAPPAPYIFSARRGARSLHLQLLQED